VESAPASLHRGGLRIDVRQVFLNKFDGDAIIRDAEEKIKAGLPLSDEDVLKLVVAPLAKSASPRQEQLERCVEAAKGIGDEQLQMFVIAGMLVASDKFIDRDYSTMVRRWLNMTKVGQIIQEEISAATDRRDKEIALKMLEKGKDAAEISEFTGLTKADIDALPLSK
jgi:hypothetical protein